ncbi:hypothetical protein H7993_19360, partial [Pseudomonas sp. MBT-2]|nr:hypothetical protein [Pseudomonas baltica]
TVVLRDSRLKPGDVLAVIWQLPDGRTLDIPYVPATVGEVRAPIPASVIAASLGKTVEVTNVILVDGGSGVTSPALALRVQDLPATAFKPPRVVQASNGVLDLNTFSGDAQVFAEPWPLIAAGQTFWLLAKGIRDDGSTYTERLPTPYTVQSAEVETGIRRVLERPQMLRLENASMLRLELKVDLTGGASEASAILFPEGEFVMATVNLNLIAPTIVGAVDGALDPESIPASGVVVKVPPYGGRDAGQMVYVEFNGQNGSHHQTAPLRVPDKTTFLNFTVSKQEVLKSTNKAVAFEYKVALADGALYSTSKPVPLKIEEVVEIVPDPIDFEEVPVGNLSSDYVSEHCEIWTYQLRTRRVANASQAHPYIQGKYHEVVGVDGARIQVRLPWQPRKVRIGYSVSKRIAYHYALSGGISRDYFIEGSGWIEYTSNTYIGYVGFALGDATLILDNITME